MLPSELMSEKLLTVNNVAELLNISPTTVRGWLVQKKIPAPDIRRHRFIRWRKSTLEEFLKEPYLWREKNPPAESKAHE